MELLNFFFDIFTTLTLTITRDLSTLTGDPELFAKLLALLIAGPLDSLQLFFCKMTGSLKLGFLQEESFRTLLGPQTILSEFLFDLAKLIL